MKVFKDKDGRDWTMAIDVNASKRVKAICGVDLFSVLDGKLIGELMGDPELLVNVIYAICKPEADAASMTDEQFGGRLVGDAIDAATKALVEDLIDFFPQARRQVIRKAVEKMRAIEAAGIELATKRIDAMAVGTIVNAVETPGDSSGNSPASSGSTLIP